jgi:predicted nucleic acid-binding protein
MDDAPFFLDVNVPMYAAGKPHAYKTACAWVLTEIAHARLDAVIDAEIVQEVLYRFGAIGRPQTGVQMAKNLLALVPTVLPITVADMETAVTLFGRYGPNGVKARDVVHAAVMQTHGITHIISTDTHFDHIEGIVRLDPQTLFAGR